MEHPDRIPVKRYYDPDFYAMECELLWPRVWQMACRLDEIPEPGDFVVYDNLGQSVIVVRVDASTVKAYHNACRHRGVALVVDRGHLQSGFECPFHGWCFGLDGKSTYVFQPDTFSPENLDPVDLDLRTCRSEVWGGFAFINFDDDAPPLRPSIAPFASYHDARHIEKMKAERWFAARLPVNWKLAMEAFMEGYHVRDTHRQLLPPGVKGRVSWVPGPGGSGTRVSLPEGTTVDSATFIEGQLHYMRILGEGMADGMVHAKDIRVAEGLRGLELPADPGLAQGVWARRLNDAIMEWNRGAGIDIPDLNDWFEQWADVGSPPSVNFCFPHFFLLPMYGNASSYRVRPLGPEECLFEIWSTTLYPDGQAPPKLSTPEPWAPNDPRWPSIPAQDFSNLPRQQKGLHTKGFEYMRLSRQGEGLIANYHRLIDGYLAGLNPDLLLAAAQKVCGPIEMPVCDIGF
jgi:nitrite reductase/ring-hydroxylating ferredoxin subunit